MGRAKKHGGRSVGVSPEGSWTIRWFYLWGLLVAVVSVLIAMLWGITVYSSTAANHQSSDVYKEEPSTPLSARPEEAVFSKGKVKIKMLSTPYTSFAKNCAKTGVPVVLKNSIVNTWTASAKWTPSYLRSKQKSLSGIYENENRWFGPYFDPTKPLLEHATRRNFYRTDVKMGVSEFFDHLHRPKEDTYHYFTGSIDDLGEWAYSEIQPLDELLFLNPKLSSVNVWIGQPHVIAHCHYDGYHNFYAQLYGTKKFTLFSPTNWPGLYPYPFLHPSHAQAQVNISDLEDVKNFGLVRQVEALEVILEAGDLLYMPPLWFHEVESQSISISVNVWTDSRQTDLMVKMFSMPLPFESDDKSSSHKHDHAEWHEPRERRIGAAVLIHRILEKICEYQTCFNAKSDRFFEPEGIQKSWNLYSQSMYFVLQLWRTRYRDLMRKGELPDQFPDEADILCENGKNKGLELTLKADTDIMSDVHFELYIEQIGQLARGLPEETWPLWIGNYVEHVAASAVSDVKYVGLFLENLSSCTKHLR